jgi:hypothetical protein
MIKWSEDQINLKLENKWFKFKTILD